MSVRSKFSAITPTTGWRLVRLAVIVGFVLLVGRHWHPYYGFTGFLQADPVTAVNLPESLRDTPLFIHRDVGRYDGVYYALIATSPTLRDPGLAEAVDNLGYRARRILLGAVAWVIGGGEPVAVVHAYAWLNPLLWFGLAWLLWRLFPPLDWRTTLAWSGMLLAAGTVLSVKLALTDLAALCLITAALMLVERGRTRAATAALGLSGLTRETALISVVALLPASLRDRGAVWRRCGLMLLAAVPLLLWLLTLWRTFSSSTAGLDNFTLPLAGWLGRWQELFSQWSVEQNRPLIATSVLDHIALTVQMIFLLVYRDKQSPWWRTGVVFAGLALLLGTAVWEGLPGAASRVLLPLTLAFNVLALRRRAALPWLLMGNLSVIGGIWALCLPPDEPHILTASTTWSQSHVTETDERWSVAEWNSKWRWAWCDGVGGLQIRIWPWPTRAQAEIQVRGVTPRTLEVWHAGTKVWQGQIGDRPQWIQLPELPVERGNLILELRSGAPATGEGVENTAREISFACYGARLVEPIQGRASRP